MEEVAYLFIPYTLFCEKHIFDVTSMFFYLYRNTLFPSLINCMKLYYKMDEKCYFTRNNT